MFDPIRLLVNSSRSCIATPLPSLLPGVSDHVLATILPTLVYIVASTAFYTFDRLGLLQQYRIHPSNEDLKRNHVSRSRCLLGVVRYHLMQITIGLLLSYGAEPEMRRETNCEVYDWVVRVRSTYRPISMMFALVGVDIRGIFSALTRAPLPSHFLRLHKPPSQYDIASTSGFGADELALAHTMVSVIAPIARFCIALAVVDTWVYFTHRLCHANKALYKIVHSQHHQLYVSYAYGAVYAHWLESFFLDIISFVMANYIAGLSLRQGMVFGSLATLKTISDHCGYVFPWDPFLYINGNGASFHDIHHQSWGLKHNFSTYTVFWDKVLATEWWDLKVAAQRYSPPKNQAATQETKDKGGHVTNQRTLTTSSLETGN